MNPAYAASLPPFLQMPRAVLAMKTQWIASSVVYETRDRHAVELERSFYGVILKQRELVRKRSSSTGLF